MNEPVQRNPPHPPCGHLLPREKDVYPLALWERVAEGRVRGHTTISEAASCQLPTTNCRLPTADCRLPTANSRRSRFPPSSALRAPSPPGEGCLSPRPLGEGGRRYKPV
jgi:hypothetical protein